MSIAVEGTGPHHSTTVAVAERAGVEPSLVPWRRLAAGDLAALLGAWAVANLVFPAGMWTTVPIPGIGMWLIASQRLYTTGIADMRTVELHRLMDVTVRLAAAAVAVQWVLPGPVSPAGVATGCSLSLVGLVLARTVYRAWLRNARAVGRFGRSVAFVGIDEHARAIRRQLADRPELGFSVVSAFGSREAAHRYGMDDVRVGHVVDAPAFVRRSAAKAVLVSTTALSPGEINPIVRDLLDGTVCQVHLTTGIGGFDQRRVRPAHLDYEPVLSIDRRGIRRGQALVKRALDVTLGSVTLLLTLPVLAVAAIAIKLGDRGPVLFRQIRVGRDGHPFTVYKLRTMTVDAETRLAHLSGHNERRGPLFKMEQDPRVTRVGSLIRDLSIDELPQLWNVLRGEMSLVGPRPALPEEDASFDDRLRERNRVRPGITGLWQVEARDNPSFLTYERLDLFYVENWSLGLDLTILVATVESELARVAKRFLPHAWRAAERSARPQLEPVVIGPSIADNNGTRVPLASLDALPRSSSAAGR
jgi:exopolysaccharide biosynthesis polyprenyl glycosylphosphotransferase